MTSPHTYELVGITAEAIARRAPVEVLLIVPLAIVVPVKFLDGAYLRAKSTSVPSRITHLICDTVKPEAVNNKVCSSLVCGELNSSDLGDREPLDPE